MTLSTKLLIKDHSYLVNPILGGAILGLSVLITSTVSPAMSQTGTNTYNSPAGSSVPEQPNPSPNGFPTYPVNPSPVNRNGSPNNPSPNGFPTYQINPNVNQVNPNVNQTNPSNLNNNVENKNDINSINNSSFRNGFSTNKLNNSGLNSNQSNPNNLNNNVGNQNNPNYVNNSGSRSTRNNSNNSSNTIIRASSPVQALW